LDVSSLNLHTSSTDLLFILEAPSSNPGPYTQGYPSSLFIWADQISPNSTLPFGINLDNKTESTYELDGEAHQLEIYGPQGILKIGNDTNIDLSYPTANSTQSLIFSSSALDKTSDLSLKVDAITGQPEIYGNASSIILDGREIGKIPWNTLPQFIQTGFFGLIIAGIAGILPQRKKLFSFFRPGRSKPLFVPGEFVCETRSGYIISGSLKQSPSRGFPYYEIEQAHRKLRTASEWESQTIAILRVSAADVEQSYRL